LQPEHWWSAQPADLPPVTDDGPEMKTVELVSVITPLINGSISAFVQLSSTWRTLI